MAKLAAGRPEADVLPMTSKTNSAYPNDDGKGKAGPRFPHGQLKTTRNIDPGNEGGYRKGGK